MRATVSKKTEDRFADADIIDNGGTQSVLLIEKDELIINRFLTLAGVFCSVVSFKTADDAGGWLNGDQKVDLIITDQCSGQQLVLMARKNPNYQFIPVLVTCLSTETNLVENTLRIKATDLLVVNEDDQSLESKIRYYLKVSTVVSATYGMRSSPSVYRFRLPWWKRAIDIGVSLTVLLLLSPLLLVVALLIVLDSKGPVFYKSKRAGTNYYIFNMYKFRSMKVQADRLLNDLSLDNLYAKSADSDNNDTAGNDRSEYLCSACRQWGVSCQHPLFDQDQPVCEKLYMQENEDLAKFMKFRNDPRITRLGTFLRNSSIDELPQLFNVLIGDMSLVGNRPLPLYEAEKLTADESARRFAGPAGLTGIWQTKKRAKGQGPMSERERILLDIEYASTFSFKTDMYIIWKTFFSLWQKENV
jgi:lipopolysaccharide/colanic/teichoic acid biosynthesis glycosyltransferase